MKRKRKPRRDLVDRFSDLPDSILGLILSHLPTKEAVATSILSKIWRFGWVAIRNLDFCCHDAFNDDDDDDDDPDENMEFIQFVNRVLCLHDTNSINKFSLEWTPYCVSSQVTSWATTLITKHVKDLSLCLVNREFSVSVPCFNCVSLTSLKLDGSIFVSSATVFCLPKLEKLQLIQVAFESEETFGKLINGCSVLDDLCIEKDYGGEFTHRISSTSLTRLTYSCYCNLKLEASSLEYLNLDNVMCISVPNNLTSLVEADIGIELNELVFSKPDECYPIVELVRASNCAKFLTLSSDVMRVLRCAKISLSTEFRRLVKLKTDVACCPWNSLRDFIQNADNLEDLTVGQHFYGHTSRHRHSKWTTPVEVPKFLSNSLKRVHIHGYKGMKEEHGMILYMLEHGSVLQVMKVSCYHKLLVGKRSELPKKIQESPKKSSACKVEIIMIKGTTQ